MKTKKLNQAYIEKFLSIYQGWLNSKEDYLPITRLDNALSELKRQESLKTLILSIAVLIPPISGLYYFNFKTTTVNIEVFFTYCFVLLFVIIFFPKVFPRPDLCRDIKNRLNYLFIPTTANRPVITKEQVKSAIENSNILELKKYHISEYHKLVMEHDTPMMKIDAKVETRLIIGYYMTERTLEIHKGDDENNHLFGSLFNIGASNFVSNYSNIITKLNNIVSEKCSKKEFDNIRVRMGEARSKFSDAIKEIDKDFAKIDQL
jgi:hypothetical protein